MPRQKKSTELKQSLSAAKLAANRANARKSTGPRTPEGKAVSSRNAVKHGLLARYIIPADDPVENPAELEVLLDGLAQTFEPQDPFEHLCIERLAASYWRLSRAIRAESRAIQSRREEDQNPMAELQRNLMGGSADPTRLVLPYLQELDRLVRYEQLIDREIQRTLTQLRQHRANRTAPPRSAPSRATGLETAYYQSPERKRGVGAHVDCAHDDAAQHPTRLPPESTAEASHQEPEAHVSRRSSAKPQASNNERAPSASEGSSQTKCPPPSSPCPRVPLSPCRPAADTTPNLKSEIRNLTSAPAPEPRTMNPPDNQTNPNPLAPALTSPRSTNSLRRIRNSQADQDSNPVSPPTGRLKNRPLLQEK